MNCRLKIPWRCASEYCSGWDDYPTSADKFVEEVAKIIDNERGRFIIMDRWQDILPYIGFLYIAEVPDDVVKELLNRVEVYCTSSAAEKVLNDKGLAPRFRDYCGGYIVPRRDDVVLLPGSWTNYLIWYLW
ncbi:MAG: hypothetical protein ACP5MH_11935 [Thermoproteus sp.]